MQLTKTSDTIAIMPSRGKQLWLIVLIVALLIIVVVTTTFMSVMFLIYMGVLLWALVNLIIRVFKSDPVLILSPSGILSNMTINGKKAGIVSWSAITDIRDVKTFGFIKGIEVYTKDSGSRFLLHLASDEAAVAHEELLSTLMCYWTTYQ